jgi:hypothetical protein
MLITLDESGVSEVEAIPFEIDVPHSRIREPDAATSQAILDRLGIK